MLTPYPSKSPLVVQGTWLIGHLHWPQWLNALRTAVNGTPGNSTPVTFANLPTPVEGMIVVVTDSTVNTWGSVIAGLGAFRVGAYYNGTNWTVCAK